MIRKALLISIVCLRLTQALAQSETIQHIKGRKLWSLNGSWLFTC